MASSGAGPIRLSAADAERYVRLRRRMLDDAPWAFGSSPADDEALDVAFVVNLFSREHHATFAVVGPSLVAGSGATATGSGYDLIAAASVTRERRTKSAHRARIWAVFVEPAHRGKGLGRAVMAAAIDLARSWEGVEFVDLGVSAHAPAAQRLYESLGFEAWGREPGATRLDEKRYDEIHMTLRL